MIYLDYQSTTPLAPEARDAMLPWLTSDGSANPHSTHKSGRAAMAAIEHARDQVAALLPPNGRVFFTSGATEALNWAIKGCGGAIKTIATEHAAVLDTALAEQRSGRALEILPVTSDGLTDFDTAFADAARPVGLVAAMLVNNETGVCQPVADICEQAHRSGALFLCDAVQGYGRVPIPADCDLIAISAHKIYGPKGIGALWVRNGVTIEPLLHGGGQEGGGRSGTLSPALCTGFGAAAALMQRDFDHDLAHVETLWQRAVAQLPDWQINGSTSARYRGNLNIRRPGVDAARLISELRDIAFSAGSACASGSGRPSHVLKAMGLSDADARSSIRIGFGRYTRPADIDDALAAINASAERQLDVMAS